MEGGVALSELEAALGHSFDRDDVSTVGGLVLAEFGRVPRSGESIDVEGYPAGGGACRAPAGASGSAVHRTPVDGPRSSRSGRLDDLARRRCSGVVLTVFGATAGAALITVSRAELTRAVGRRLRGAAASLAGLAQIDRYLTAASATTSLGVLLLGAAVPGLLAGQCVPSLVAAGAGCGAAGAVRRLSGAPLADPAARRECSGPGHAHPASLVPSARAPAAGPRPRPGPPTFGRSGGRERRSVDRAMSELMMVGGVMAFTARPVREVMTPTHRHRRDRRECATG